MAEHTRHVTIKPADRKAAPRLCCFFSALPNGAVGPCGQVATCDVEDSNGYRRPACEDCRREIETR